MFLYLESRETMMHVAGLLTFAPPPDTPPDHLRRLVDGYSAMRVLAQSLSKDAEDRSQPLFFAVEPSRRAPASEPAGIHFPELIAAVRAQVGTSRSVAGALVNMARSRLRSRELVSPLQAPKSIFNRRISRSRRFATQ